MTIELARAQVLLHPHLFRKDFYQHITDNFHVFQAFEREANNAWDRGRRHYSGRTIIEYLRHESNLREHGDGLKLNDWYTPDYCRLYVTLHPERNLFEFRGERRAA